MNKIFDIVVTIIMFLNAILAVILITLKEQGYTEENLYLLRGSYTKYAICGFLFMCIVIYEVYKFAKKSEN
jgi:uncharacterized membrane protein